MIARDVRPFLWVAIGWWGLGAALSAGSAPALAWHSAFWAFCLLDLLALGKLVQTLFRFSTEKQEENRGPRAIQALFWAALKLGCLGIFVWVALHGRAIAGSGFPAFKTGMTTGLATLVVIPLVGGLWWSQRVLRHA